MRTRFFSAIAIAISGALIIGQTACQTSPTGREQVMLPIPDSQLDAMGAQAFQDLKAKEPADTDPSVNAYVKCVANAITNVLPEKRSWEVVVFKNKEANAFALPGGKIGVYSGLLPIANSPAQLAAVLGHEIGHVLAKHGKERMSDQFIAAGGLKALQIVFSSGQGPKYNLIMAALGLGAQYGILLPFSRAQETEADIIGLQLMAKAGFDPEQSLDLWKNMEKSGGAQPPEILSDHPAHGTRIETLQEHMNEAKAIYAGVSHKTNCGK